LALVFCHGCQRTVEHSSCTIMLRLTASLGWCCLLLHQSRLHVSGERGVTVKEEELQHLKKEFGELLFGKWTECFGQTARCGIGSLMVELALTFNKLRTGFDTCLGRKCSYNQAWCNRFYMAIWPYLDQLRVSCQKDGDWPSSCTALHVAMNIYRTEPAFELNTMCNVIQPGGLEKWGTHMKPLCSSMAQSMMSSYKTLSNCAGMPRDQCVSHFCGLQREFFWRMKPRQIQDTSRCQQNNLFPG